MRRLRVVMWSLREGCCWRVGLWPLPVGNPWGFWKKQGAVTLPVFFCLSMGGRLGIYCLLRFRTISGIFSSPHRGFSVVRHLPGQSPFQWRLFLRRANYSASRYVHLRERVIGWGCGCPQVGESVQLAWVLVVGCPWGKNRGFFWWESGG